MPKPTEVNRVYTTREGVCYVRLNENQWRAVTPFGTRTGAIQRTIGGYRVELRDTAVEIPNGFIAVFETKSFSKAMSYIKTYVGYYVSAENSIYKEITQ